MQDYSPVVSFLLTALLLLTSWISPKDSASMPQPGTLAVESAETGKTAFVCLSQNAQELKMGFKSHAGIDVIGRLIAVDIDVDVPENHLAGEVSLKTGAELNTVAFFIQSGKVFAAGHYRIEVWHQESQIAVQNFMIEPQQGPDL